MWPKIKFGTQIFVTDVMSKFMCKISRKTTYLENMAGNKHGKQYGLKHCYEIGHKCLKEVTDNVSA